LEILETQTQRDPTVLDEKIAEYVFFPLFYIFRQVDQYPMLLIENCVKCLNILIVHGWKSKISPQLVQQILSLLTFILDGDPGSESKRDIPEETVLETLRALNALFKTAASYASVAAGLASSEAIPALGHSITVILETIVDGANAQIQQEAVHTIESVYMAIKDQGALASFLPGTVSSLTKVLSTPGRYKSRVLSKSLDAVRLVLTKVLGDMQTRPILAQAQKDPGENNLEEDKGKVLSPAWLKATAAQVKLALAKIMKIRTHDASEVRQALCRLCVTLLDECHNTLSDCANFLVETAVMLDSGGLKDAHRTGLETTLRDLATIYPELSETTKAIVYNWMSSLPHAMQASDESVKESAIRNLTHGLAIIRDLQIESSTLDDLLSDTLRDTVTALISGPGASSISQIQHVQLLTDGSQEMASMSANQLDSVLLSHESQRRVKIEMMNLIRSVATSSQQSKLAASIMDQVRDTTDESQVAAFWLCFEIVKSAHQSSADDSALLDLTAFDEPKESIEDTFNDIYSFSVQVLDSHTDLTPSDWRLEAIALEVIAHAAQRTGPSFKPELIDVLFPITTFLGSESPELQQYAIITLNELASSCQYGNVSELIIDNIDYMVNAVSLRLNTLDISPASTQVLAMMIRLAGPRVIPFLDDVVESIFVALENYHAYSAFVENLFTVLKETVNQGAQSNALLLEGQKRSRPNHLKKNLEAKGLDDLLEFLEKQSQRKEREKAEAAEDEKIKSHPNAPWKRENNENPVTADDEEPTSEADGEREEQKEPNSPTYQLLVKIATLTQYYLTSPAPKLRRTLLEILTTASSALAADEDSFLPLVNAIWPVVIARLRDEEAYVVIETCQTLSHLCEAAGDFLSTRFKSEWSSVLRKWCYQAKQHATDKAVKGLPREKKLGLDGNASGIVIPIRSASGLDAKSLGASNPSIPSGSLGQYAAPQKIWEAVVKLLTSVVSFVRVDDDMFEDILDLLAEAMEKDDGVQQALENINADAVWLTRYERGLVEKMDPPTVEGVVFKEM
jgi:hypothetical protein